MNKTCHILFAAAVCIAIAAAPCFPDEFSLSRQFQTGEHPEEAVPERIVLTEADEEEYYDDEYEDEDYMEEEEEGIADPLEPVNRFFFQVNDKLYFWILKPVAKGYSKIVPEKIRIGVKNVFDNIYTPARFVNNLLQFKVEAAGSELIRFGVNSTAGVLGYFDIARDRMNIRQKDEDFGQTLGVWGLGPIIYINWPFLGPSSVRDTLGFAGDYFLDPVNYVTPSLDRYAIKASDRLNRTSLSIGEYEEIKKDAIDPYAAVRDIYYQYRKSKISK